MNFKQWLILSESSFFKINDEQKKAVLDIVQKLKNLKGADFGMALHQYGNKEIGIIPYDYPDSTHSTDSAKDFDDFIIPNLNVDIDRRLKVFIDFNNTKKSAEYKSNVIFITWNYIQYYDVPTLYKTLTHELGHAIDSKLKPFSKHKVSDKYNNYVKQHLSSPIDGDSERIHYIEPVEVDAEGLSMQNHVMEYFKALRTIKDKQEFIKELETWLKKYFTINSKDQPLPKVLSHYYWDFEHARSKPTLFRQYQKRFYKLIQDLKANIETTGNTYDTLFKGKENNSDHPANYQRSIYSDTAPAPKPKSKNSFFGSLVQGFLGR
jgi:hypothetical protein